MVMAVDMIKRESCGLEPIELSIDLGAQFVPDAADQEVSATGNKRTRSEAPLLIDQTGNGAVRQC